MRNGTHSFPTIYIPNSYRHSLALLLTIPQHNPLTTLSSRTSHEHTLRPQDQTSACPTAISIRRSQSATIRNIGHVLCVLRRRLLQLGHLARLEMVAEELCP